MLLSRTARFVVGRNLRRASTAIDPAEGLTEEQVQVQAIARDFASNELAPNMAAWDASEEFPVATLRKAASLGFSGISSAPSQSNLLHRNIRKGG